MCFFLFRPALIFSVYKMCAALLRLLRFFALIRILIIAARHIIYSTKKQQAGTHDGGTRAKNNEPTLLPDGRPDYKWPVDYSVTNPLHPFFFFARVNDQPKSDILYLEGL
jgi:hypothetical protein